jgi:hypothetical protein
MLSSIAECIGYEKRTQRTETSQYLQEKKSTETPLVAASESGIAQTERKLGVAGANKQLQKQSKQNGLESPAIAGDSPVCESLALRYC